MRFRVLLLCSIVALIVAASALVALAAEPPVRVALVDAPTTRTIKVSAMREIEVVPDEVVLSLSVITEDEKSPLPAKAENDKRTRAILKTIKSHGVEDKYVKIDCLEIHPVYQHRDQTLIQYTVTRGIDVTLQNFDLLEPILSDALGVGANRVGGILFRTTKHREHQFEARRLAVAYAREKAGHLAELNGLALGKAITIEEEVEGDIHTRGSGGMGGGMGEMTNSFKANTGRARIVLVGMGKDREGGEVAAQTTPDARQTIAPGTITISATVTITFELKEPKQP
jgi:uncharacterized protein